LLVSENMNIQAGQQIATMGSSGTDTVKLHFELRRRGQPIDPLTLLPRRR
jgi:lipoprotein NlpD